MSVAASVWIAVSAIVGAADPAVALRERFLDATGLPSETAYAKSHGILPAPGSETFDWKAIFKLSYKTADLARLKNAQPLHTDCYFIRTRKYRAPYRATPVWDGRVYHAGEELRVAAFTSKGERVYGYINEYAGVSGAEKENESAAMPDLEGVDYNPFTGQLWRRAAGGEIEEQQRFYLPLPLLNRRGESVRLKYEVVSTRAGEFALVAKSGGQESRLANCNVSGGDEVIRTDGFRAAPAPGFAMVSDQPTTVLEVRGEIGRDVIDFSGPQLVTRLHWPVSAPRRPEVIIDGRFDEWRNVRGISDPEGDIASHLQYNADTDLLEFKVFDDEEHLFFYTRVAGRHGNTGQGRDRYYFYVYIDTDRNAATGYVPTRDDDCYYGVALGDDCEAQFEFIGGRFVKSFFGFAGRSTEKDILAGRATIGPSWYAKHDEHGRLREGYKVEYIRQAGKISITEDEKEGTGDDIAIALSPDGSECEMRVAMSGFLKDSHGKPIIAPGQRVDLAAGVEASGLLHGNSKWGADSTAVIRGYRVAK